MVNKYRYITVDKMTACKRRSPSEGKEANVVGSKKNLKKVQYEIERMGE
jgi:hypothetical protein